MPIERVDRVTTPLVVGRYYLVPTVRMRYFSDKLDNIPVIGPKHEDKEFFNFEAEHYHCDVRFMSQRWFNSMGFNVLVAPVTQRRDDPLDLKIPSILWMKKKCCRSSVDYPFGDRKAICYLKKHYSGKQCSRGKGGWICPHRKAPLGSIQPDVNGIITCFLHGLEIDATTGIVV